MDTRELERRVREMIEPVVSSLGVELDYVEVSKMRGRLLVRIFIDKEGGVTVDDCEYVSREIEAILDVEDPIPSSYVLEVSSPGLDRPLRNPDDFKRFSGRTARIITKAPLQNQTFFVGDIETAGDEEVVLLMDGGKRVAIPYSIISRARLEVNI
jgi:ribosome maturation factor RimP